VGAGQEDFWWWAVLLTRKGVASGKGFLPPFPFPLFSFAR